LLLSQIYIKGYFLNEAKKFEAPNLIQTFIAKDTEKDLGTIFIFDDRELSPGMEYNEAFSARFLQITKYFNLKEKEYSIYTYYSNAELSAMIPLKENIKEIMLAQGDTESVKKGKNNQWKKDTQKNLTILDINGSAMVKNYKYNLPYTLNILDTRHFYSQGNLADLGKGLRIQKKTEIDFPKNNALYYFENHRETFLEYAGIDAIIPVEASLNLAACTRQLASDLAAKGVIENVNTQSVQRFIKKQFVTAASMVEGLMELAIKKQGLRNQFLAHQQWCDSKLPNEAKKNKGGANKAFQTSPTLLIKQLLADIASAYAQTMKDFDLLLGEPTTLGHSFTTAFALTKELDRNEVHHAYINFSFELPPDTNEWERILVMFDQKQDMGFTGTKTGTNQWFTLAEVQALATVHPNLEI
jgi:hypothetical protein